MKKVELRRLFMGQMAHCAYLERAANAKISKSGQAKNALEGHDKTIIVRSHGMQQSP